MARCRAAVVAAVGSAVAVARISAVAAAAKDAVDRGALGADDACMAGAGPGCAIQALQQRSSRGPATPLAAESGVAPEGIAARLANASQAIPDDVKEAIQETVQGAVRNVSQTIADANEAAAAADAVVRAGVTDSKGRQWIWDEEAIKDQYVFSSGRPNWAVNVWAKPVVDMVSFFCSRWLSYNWPKAAFWSQEVLRRTEALPETPSPTQKEHLEAFVNKASFLTCVYDFDPQSGTDWSPHVSEYMERVGRLPSTSLEMPMLDGWFTEPYEALELYSLDACMFWVTSNFCDLAHLARDLKGSKDYGDGICWDKVPKRAYELTISNDTYSLPFNFNLRATDDDFAHEEFLACQEKPFTQEVLDRGCPMFGHYPDGMWGMTDMGRSWSWGERPKPGSEHFETVMSCSSKLGVPGDTRMHFAEMYPYADYVGLMDTPEWKKNATDILENKLGLK